MRNGAWQPLACTRLPECNFPIITLPNFSASVKDHLLTQWSQARAARRRGPSLGIIFNRRRKHIRSSFPACAVSPRDKLGPGRWPPPAWSRSRSRSRGACPPIALSHPPMRPTASPLSPIVVSDTSHPHSQGQPLRSSPVRSICHLRDICRVTYTVTCPTASQPLQFHLLKPSPTHVLHGSPRPLPRPQPRCHPPRHTLTDAFLTALSCPSEQSRGPSEAPHMHPHASCTPIAPQPAAPSPLPLCGPRVSRGLVQGH